MFDNLIVSAPEKKSVRKSLPSTFSSLAFHVLLVWGLIATTQKVEEVIEESVMDTTMIVIQEEEPEPEPEPDEPPPVVSLQPPPKGFQTVSAPVDIPTEIPPIDLSERFDPRDFSGVGVEGGVFSGVEGGTGPVDLDQVFMEAVADEKPERLSCPRPQYPPLLQQAGIQGSVLMEAVIDTTGHVEEGSINVLRSDHKGFERPAIAMLSKCLYRPGRVRGRPVRILIRQPVAFGIRS